MEKTGTILVVGKDGNMLSETDVGQREARKISQDLESGISPVKRSNEMLWKRVRCTGACGTNCPLDVCSCWHNPSNQFCERQSGV